MHRISILCFLILGVLWMTTTHANPNNLTLATPAFLDGGMVPIIYTCDGQDISPQISWANAPLKTQSFALILSDPDAPGGVWYHWVVYNIPADAKEFAENIQRFPGDTEVGKNSWDKAQYSGPCPPKGAAH